MKRAEKSLNQQIIRSTIKEGIWEVPATDEIAHKRRQFRNPASARFWPEPGSRVPTHSIPKGRVSIRVLTRQRQSTQSFWRADK
jgi:hypothetical protein